MNRETFISLLSKELGNEISDIERIQLQQAIEANREYRQIHDTITLYCQTKQAQNRDPAAKLKEIWDKVALEKEHIPPRSSVRSPKFFLKIAAVFIGLGGLIFLSANYYFNHKAKGWITLTTREDSLYTQLKDGTRLTLYKNSILEYNNDFGVAKRQMVLKGEAFFDVASNKKVPLIIQAGAVNIEVKGTAFQVSAYGNTKTTQIALFRGLVEVSNRLNKNQKVVLKPNEQLVIPSQPDQAFHYTINAIPPSGKGEIYRRQDTLFFKKKKFADLALVMEKKYQVTIEIKNEALKQKRFSGMFTRENLVEALDALKISYPFTYVITDSLIVIE